MKTLLHQKTTINCDGRLLNLSSPKVMGILNITPDSFYDGGKYNNPEAIKKQVEQMLAQGADIIDIGAYSSRPGAKHISEEEEKQRLQPILELFAKDFSTTIVSLDTFRAEIAEWAVKNYKVAIINDISAGEMDAKMFETIGKLNVPYIIMHMQGTPQTMQQKPEYKNIIEDIIAYFSKKVHQLKQLGIHDVIIDPGFGFGKSLDHNYQLLKQMDELKILGLPVLAGISRKSMIYKHLGCTPDEALNGTTALNMMALAKGASILRVHDVKEAREAVSLFEKIIEH